MNLITRLDRIVDPFAPANGTPPTALWPFVRWALRGSERLLLGVMGIVFLAASSEMVAAWYTGWIIDVAQTQGPGAFWQAFWPMIVVGVIFFLIARPLIFAADASVSSILLEPNLFPLVLSRINKHTLGHSMRYFDNDFAGRISQKQMQTSRALTSIVSEISDVVIYAMVMFTVALGLMASVDPRLLGVFVVWGVLYGIALWWFIPQVQHRSAVRAGARTQVTGQIVDALSNIATVKLFAHDDSEDRAARDALARYRIRAIDFGVISAVFRLVLMTLGGMLPLFSILGVVYLWSAGAASVGEIAMTAMVATRLSQITQRLGRTAIVIFADLGEIEDGIETLAPAHEIADRPNAQDRTAPHGAILYDNVHFAYGGKIPAVDGINLTVAPGEKVALVGASGAGKSTLTSLLLRLYDVEGGRIMLDGTDIRDMTQTALRRSIAIVRQETSMFNRSAMDNIRYGRPDASDAEVIEAARQAEAHEFILMLSDHRGNTGYQARLGERGVKLSGGQRQRIALARAFLKDAPILVLDEATSALDSEAEAAIQRTLHQVMQGKTVIAIAHRLSTIAQMDRIVVLEQGQIVEEGNHADLLAHQGRYARYWARQSGGFLDATSDQAAE